jgi:hypothetical protein
LVDLVANNVDAALVARVQMDDVGFVDLRIPFLMLVDEVDDGGGFAGAWRAVEKEIGEIIFFEDIFEDCAIHFIENNFFEPFGAIFFDPWNIGFSGFGH